MAEKYGYFPDTSLEIVESTRSLSDLMLLELFLEIFDLFEE